MATMFTSFRFVNRSAMQAQDVRLLSANLDDYLKQRCPPAGTVNVEPMTAYECNPDADDQEYAIVVTKVGGVWKSAASVPPPSGLYLKSLLADLDPGYNLILTPGFGNDDAKHR